MSHKEVPDSSIDAYNNLDVSTKEDAMRMIIYALKNMPDGGNTWETAGWIYHNQPTNKPTRTQDSIHEFIKRRFDDVLKVYDCIGRKGDRRSLKSGNTGNVWRYGVKDEREAVYSKSQKSAADYAQKIIDHAHVPKVQKKIDLEFDFSEENK